MGFDKKLGIGPWDTKRKSDCEYCEFVLSLFLLNTRIKLKQVKYKLFVAPKSDRRRRLFQATGRNHNTRTHQSALK